MDPLSKIGATSAVGSLADSGAKLSQLLLEIAAAADPQIGFSDEGIEKEKDIVNESTLLCDLGTEISLFCATSKQLQRVLSVTDASGVSVVDNDGTQVYQPQIQGRRCRASLEAFDTAHEIVARCKRIFAKIQRLLDESGITISGTGTAVTSSSMSGWRGADRRDLAESSSLLSGLAALSLQGSANAGNVKVLGDVNPAELRARLKKLIRKGKIQTYKATMESCKITLTLVVTTLAYAEVVSARRLRDEKATIEDTEQDVLIRSLVLAQKHANNRLALVELEDESAITDVGTNGTVMGISTFNSLRSGFQFSPSRSQTPITAFRPTGMLGSPTIAPAPQSFDDDEEDDTEKEERASVWLKRLMSDKSRSDSGHSSAVDSGFCSRKGSATSSSEVSNSLSSSIATFPSSSRYSLIESLLAKWTDQAPHWASLQYQQPTTSTLSAITTNTAPTAAVMVTTSTVPRGPGTPRKGGIKRPGAPTSLGLATLAAPKIKNANGFAHWNKVTAYHVPQADSAISLTSLGSRFGKSMGTSIVTGTSAMPDKPIFSNSEFKFGSGDGIARTVSEPVSPSSKPAGSKQQEQQQNRGFTSLLSLDSSTSVSPFDVTTDYIDPAWGIPTQQQAGGRRGLFL